MSDPEPLVGPLNVRDNLTPDLQTVWDSCQQIRTSLAAEAASEDPPPSYMIDNMLVSVRTIENQLVDVVISPWREDIAQ